MKKYISLFLMVLLIVSSFATVSAEVVEVTRAWICDCGGQVTLRSTDTGSWRNVGVGVCPHGNIDHHRVIQERTVVKHYKCSNCSYAEDIVSTDRREVCQ